MIKKLFPLLILAIMGAPMYCASEENTEDSYRILVDAIERQNLNAVRQFITSHPEEIRLEYEASDTPVHIAIEKDSYAIARLLLEHGARANAKNSDGETPLHIAAQHGHLPLVQLLISFGAEIDSEIEDTGHTPLHKAAEGGHLAVVHYLVNCGADTSAVDDQDNAPVFHAIVFGKPHVAVFLAHYTPSENHLNDTYDKALFLAANRACSKLVKFFIMQGARMEKIEQEKSVLDTCNELEFLPQTREEKNERAKTLATLFFFGAPLGKYGDAILQKNPHLKLFIERYNRAVFNWLEEYLPQVLQHEILSFVSPIGIGNLENPSKRPRKDADQEDSESGCPSAKKQRKSAKP